QQRSLVSPRRDRRSPTVGGGVERFPAIHRGEGSLLRTGRRNPTRRDDFVRRPHGPRLPPGRGRKATTVKTWTASGASPRTCLRRVKHCPGIYAQEPLRTELLRINGRFARILYPP